MFYRRSQSQWKVALLSITLFLFTANVGFSAGKASSRRNEDPQALILRVQGVKGLVQELQRLAGNDPWIDKRSVLSSIQTLNKRILSVAKEPEARAFGQDLAISAQHQYPEHTLYCDSKDASCECPRFQGWSCSECDCGDKPSWANRCERMVFCDDWDETAVKCSEFTFLLPVTGVVSLFQLVLQPMQLSNWSAGKMQCPKVGCPLEDQVDANNLRAHLVALNGQLDLFVNYLNSGKVEQSALQALEPGQGPPPSTCQGEGDPSAPLKSVMQ